MYTEKLKLSVSFMLLFAIIMSLPTRQLSRQKTNFFPSHFASISSCSASLVGLIWSKNIVLYIENEHKTILTIRTQDRRQKWRKMWKLADIER